MLEMLEARRLLSFGVSNNVLVINGTQGSDDIAVKEIAGSFTVTINDEVDVPVTQPFVTIRVNALGGNDIVNLGEQTRFAIVYGGQGNDTITGGSGGNYLYGEQGADDLTSGFGNDFLSGGPDNDYLTVARGGVDVFFGGGGNDAIDYVAYQIPDDIEVPFNLRISLNGIANDGPVNLNGVLDLSDRDNVGGDIENVFGGAGSDVIIGNGRPNFIDGRGGHDYINGGGGNDNLQGGEGNDQLYGGGGNDQLGGGAGNDFLSGQAGGDFLDGGTGADNLLGGGGVDTANYGGATFNVVVTIDGIADDGQVDTDGFQIEFDNVNLDVEDVIGSAFNDQIIGSRFRNFLDGGTGGRDTLNGGAGNDTLYVRTNPIIGNFFPSDPDVLIGGPGNDLLVADDNSTDDILLGDAGWDTARFDFDGTQNPVQDTLGGDIERKIFT